MSMTLHKDVKISYQTRWWQSSLYPVYNVVMVAPKGLPTARQNLEKLIGTTVECRLFYGLFFHPWNGKVKFKTWKSGEKICICGPKSFQLPLFYTECDLRKGDLNHTELHLHSRIDNNGLVALIALSIFVLMITVLLGISGNITKILLLWLLIGLFYLILLQSMLAIVQNVYAFVWDWLVDDDRLMPKSISDQKE